MTHIDDLNVYVWPTIFKNLSINDLFNCRLVNKKFKDFSNHVKGPKRLIIGEYDYNDNKFWHTNKKAINEDDVINLNKFNKIRLLSLFNLERYLKYLYIDKLNFSFNFEDLSFLNNLEYLVINDYPIQPTNQAINLNNLKFLLLNGYCDFKLSLNLPLLSKMNIYSINNISFASDPISIEHLVIHKYDDQIKIFKNLKIIELTRIKNKIDILSFFNKLKQLKIRSKSYNSTLKFFIFNALQNKLTEKKDLDIYFNGVKIKDAQHFSIDHQHFNEPIYQLKNYDSLDLNQFTDTIAYCLLEHFYNYDMRALPINFFDVYSNIVNVCLTRISHDNIDHFYWFLTNLKRKSIFLNLQGLILNQDFYDNLPNVIRALQIIQLNLDIDFNFLFKLTNLYWFETDKESDLFQLAYDLFSKLKCFKHFAFRFNNYKIRIQLDHLRFKLFYGSKLLGKELDYFELIKLCNGIKQNRI